MRAEDGMINQDAPRDLAITKAVVAIRGLCGHSISDKDIDLLKAVGLGEGRRRVGCVAVISHRGHVHYVAAVFRSGRGWEVEQAAHTSSDQGVPRIAPAIFIGPDSHRSCVLGWAPSARATHMVLEIGSYRSSSTPIETGIVIAEFNLPMEGLASVSRIHYFDETGEFHIQSFGATGGFMATELSLQRER